MEVRGLQESFLADNPNKQYITKSMRVVGQYVARIDVSRFMFHHSAPV
jgi:hypothetical protein